jgi:hypothetical protein
MSRKHFCEHERCEKKNTFFGFDNCCCDFPTLIILILIILQFNKKGGYFGGPTTVAVDGEGCGAPAPVLPTFLGGFNSIDNSILFIIALFFLACCNPCRR